MPTHAWPSELIPEDIKNLISGIKSGDTRAFETVFNQYYNRLYAFAVDHSLDGDSASDIVQQVMVTFWQRRGEWVLPTGSALTGYLFKATRNLINKHYRDSANRDRLLSEELSTDSTPALSTSPPLPDQRASLKELETDIDRIIAAMPTDRRIATTLRIYDGMEYEEIAEVMGVSVTAARMHLSRARSDLASVLKKHRF